MRIILTFLAILSLQLAYCKYRVIQLNCPYIIVSGQMVHKGDVIPDKSEIEWSNAKQAVRILDLKTKRQYLLTAKMFARNNKVKIEDVLLATKQLSSRSKTPSTILELSSAIPDSIFVLGEALIPCDLETDDNKFFFARYQYKGESINKQLVCTEDGIILDEGILYIDGNRIESSDIVFDLYYYDSHSGNVVRCKEDIYLELLPQDI